MIRTIGFLQPEPKRCTVFIDGNRCYSVRSLSPSGLGGAAPDQIMSIGATQAEGIVINLHLFKPAVLDHTP